MACGECGDPRNLCRCSIAAGDSSVTITGDGSPQDPYTITAPGAGAGTRAYDRAGVYDSTLSGTYPALPTDYPHLDFYGPANPVDIPGYTPAQFDGWYRTGRNGLIALEDSGVAQEALAGTSVQFVVPQVHDNDVAIVTLAASGGSPVTPGDGWVQIAVISSTLTGAYFKVLKASDSGHVYQFAGLLAPVGGYYEIYSGVDPEVLDVAPGMLSSGINEVPSLTLASISPVTAGCLLVSCATIDDAAAKLVAPPQMSTVNQSSGNTYRHMVATQLQAAPGPVGNKTWTHTPTPPSHRYSGILMALRPAITGTYYLWINGRWVQVGGAGGSDDGGSGGAGGGYVTTIGDGTHSVFTVVHPLATLDVLVECVNLGSGQTCYPVVQRTSLTTVYLDFGDTTPTANSRRVLITKVG